MDRNGDAIIATADQSIQAGDGGTGFALDIQAYKPTYFNSTLYFSGTYLFNPRNTNGVRTFRTRRGEDVMSVADQYLYRGGVSHAVPKTRGLAFRRLRSDSQPDETILRAPKPAAMERRFFGPRLGFAKRLSSLPATVWFGLAACGRGANFRLEFPADFRLDRG